MAILAVRVLANPAGTQNLASTDFDQISTKFVRHEAHLCQVEELV